MEASVEIKLWASAETGLGPMWKLSLGASVETRLELV